MGGETSVEETPVWKHLKCCSEVCNALLLGLGCDGLRVDELEDFVKWRREDFGNVKGIIIMYNIDPSERNLKEQVRSDPKSLFFATAVIDETSLLAGMLNVVYNCGLCELDVGQKLIEHTTLPFPIDPISNGFAILKNKQMHKLNNTIAKLKFAVGSVCTYNHSEVIIPFENQVYGLDCSRGSISNLNRSVEPHNWFARIADKLTYIMNAFHRHDIEFTIMVVVTDIKHPVKIQLAELLGEIQTNGIARADKLSQMYKLENAFTRNYCRGQFLFDNLVCYSDEQRILMNMLFGQTRGSCRNKSKFNSSTRRQFLKRTSRAYDILLRKRALKDQKNSETKIVVSQQVLNERLGFPKGKPLKVMKSKQTILAAKGQKAMQALEKKTKELNDAISKQRNGNGPQINTSKRTNRSPNEDDDDMPSKNVGNKNNKMVKRDVDAVKQNGLKVVQEKQVRNEVKGERAIVTDNEVANIDKKKLFLQQVSEASVVLFQSVSKGGSGSLETMRNASYSMSTKGKNLTETTCQKNSEKEKTKIKGKQQKEKSNDKANEALVVANDLKKTKIKPESKNTEAKVKKEKQDMKIDFKESKIEMNGEEKMEEKEMKVLKTEIKDGIIQVYEGKMEKRKGEVELMVLETEIKNNQSSEISNGMQLQGYFVLGAENGEGLEDANNNEEEDKADETISSDKLKSKNKFSEMGKVNSFISCGISDISSLAKEASIFALGIPLD